ncbi:MAG TPA: hypothetical protein VK530_07875 [Candidatus Acidoferrum sp.]|nr:hypothetical protein [Candidatus Acidoferrum sp.]
MICTILHLEDDDDDSFFFERALSRLQSEGRYRRVSSVDEAIHYFTGTGSFSDRTLNPLPDVLVADSNLGSLKTTGHLMSWLNDREEFRSLIRVMLTGGVSATEADKQLHEGVACVLPKGANLEELTRSVAQVLRLCELR